MCDIWKTFYTVSGIIILFSLRLLLFLLSFCSFYFCFILRVVSLSRENELLVEILKNICHHSYITLNDSNKLLKQI